MCALSAPRMQRTGPGGEDSGHSLGRPPGSESRDGHEFARRANLIPSGVERRVTGHYRVMASWRMEVLRSTSSERSERRPGGRGPSGARRCPRPDRSKGDEVGEDPPFHAIVELKNGDFDRMQPRSR